MKSENIQTLVICAIFSFLGVALYYQWFTSARNRGKHSPWRRYFTLFAAGVLCPLGWLAMDALLGLLPPRWASWGLTAAALTLTVLIPALRRHAEPTAEEKASTQRLQIGILIGGALLIAGCLFVFWPRW